MIMEPQIFVDKITFNDSTTLPIARSDIVIFTGANNAGKSQVLKDVDLMMDSIGSKGIVATSLEVQYDGDIQERENDYKTKDGRYRIGGNVFNEFDTIKGWWSNKQRIFAGFFKNRLNTEMRLQASNNSQSFDV